MAAALAKDTAARGKEAGARPSRPASPGRSEADDLALALRLSEEDSGSSDSDDEPKITWADDEHVFASRDGARPEVSASRGESSAQACRMAPGCIPMFPRLPQGSAGKGKGKAPETSGRAPARAAGGRGDYLTRVREEEGYDAYRSIGRGLGVDRAYADPVPQPEIVRLRVCLDLTNREASIGGMRLQLSPGAGTLYSAVEHSLSFPEGSLNYNGWLDVLTKHETIKASNPSPMAMLQAVAIAFHRDVYAVAIGSNKEDHLVYKIQTPEPAGDKPLVLMFRGEIDSAKPWLMTRPIEK
jgi:hypothetical protein